MFYVFVSYSMLMKVMDSCAVQCSWFCCRYLLQLQKLCTKPFIEATSLVTLLVVMILIRFLKYLAKFSLCVAYYDVLYAWCLYLCHKLFVFHWNGWRDRANFKDTGWLPLAYVVRHCHEVIWVSLLPSVTLFPNSELSWFFAFHHSTSIATDVVSVHYM